MRASGGIVRLAMARGDVLKRAATGLVLVTLLAAMHSADAQKRRLPSRAEEVPDTESGRPAASAEKPTFKGRLLIYGPSSLPVTPPAEHVKPAPESAPVAAPAESVTPAPAAPVAAPAPKPEPAPVVSVTPVPAPPPPVTTPIPAAAPPPVAKPAPAQEPPPPVAKPAPAQVPPPPPVAKPAPAPKPLPPVAKPAPVVVPPAAPATALAPPAPAATPVPAPVVKPAPIAAPAPKPVPIVRSAPAAAPRQDVALAVPSAAAVPSPAAPTAIDPKLIESIFACLSPGLPQDWKKAWIEITDVGADKEKDSKFYVTNQYGDDQGEPLVPCNAPAVTRGILSLNEKLPPDRRAWTRARLVIDSEGEYELSYDYPK